MYVCNVLQNLSKKQMLHIPVERQHLFENKTSSFIYKPFIQINWKIIFSLLFQIALPTSLW